MRHAGSERSYPAARPSLSNHLTRQILDLIQREHLQPGDKLPTVRQLAKRLSVAPPTLREALRRLQATGVLEIKHGSGIYVRNGRERIVLANPSHEPLDSQIIIDLLKARLLIEPHLAGLAAERVDNEQITGLEGTLTEAERHLDGQDDEALHRANMGFHAAVANFSGNLVLAQTMESFVDLYSFEQLAILSFYDDRAGDHREHVEILSAIRDRNPVRARELMYQHIASVKDTVEAQLSRKGAGSSRQGLEQDSDAMQH